MTIYDLRPYQDIFIYDTKHKILAINLTKQKNEILVTDGLNRRIYDWEDIKNNVTTCEFNEH